MPKKRITKLYLNPAPAHKKGRTDWDRLRTMSEAEIESQRWGDPNLPEIDWANADVQLVEPIVKKPVSIRLDSDVIDFFKDAGKGYQTRINQILRSYMEHQKKTG